MIEKPKLCIDPFKSVSVFHCTFRLISKDLVHFFKSQVLSFGNDKVDKSSTDKAYETEKDECAVAHVCNHQRCSLADL